MVKVQYSDLKTPTWQRVVIWVIAIALAGGTLVGFFFMAFAAKNPSVDPGMIAQQKMITEYEKRNAEDQKKQEALQKEEQKSFAALSGYEKQVAKFDAKKVKKLAVKVLKEGKGATVGADSKISANYTGWTPEGLIFDSTKNKDEDATPREFALNQVITGWTEALKNRRVGGVYLLEIPTEKAYGAAGAPPFIQPDMPLKFIVQIVDLVE